jgi:hypothetical protein
LHRTFYSSQQPPSQRYFLSASLQGQGWEAMNAEIELVQQPFDPVGSMEALQKYMLTVVSNRHVNKYVREKQIVLQKVISP